VKPSAMAPSLKTHFLEAHRCSIPSTPSPHILRAFTFLCVVYLRVSSLSRASGRGSSLVFGVHRASFLDWGSFHGSDSSIFWYLRCHRVCASSRFRLWATGLPFPCLPSHFTSCWLAPGSASCFESSVVSGLVCCLPFPRPSVGVRPFGFHRSESS
jgi:hypothetical protein